MVIGQRVGEQRAEGLVMSSCRFYFEEGAERFGVDRRLIESGSWNERREVASVLLGAEGGLVRRENGGKYCVKCEERFEGY